MTVVGASLAGLTAATALRSAGFDGHVVVVGDEARAPYDRPPLSKDFLAGSSGPADLELADGTEDLALEWRLGERAAELDTAGRAVVLASGERVVTDGVVVTTGARARTLPGAPPRGVHTLRTLDDAVALRADLRPGARLVVIGGGFIGAEVASTARGLGVEVTVVEAAAAPLGGRFGSAVSEVCLALHRAHGTRVLCGVGVSGVVGAERVTGVRLDDGREIPADVVVVGVGSTPNVEWLASSGLASPSGVLTSERGATAVGEVVAAGDCAAPFDPGHGRAVRNEHWSNAQQQPRAAIASLLDQPYTKPASARHPYFWSDQYGRRLQFAGRLVGDEEVEVVEGDPDGADLVAVYRRAGDAVAVFAVDRARAFGSWRRSLTAPPPSVQDAPPHLDRSA